MTLSIASSVFPHNADIPQKYTCDGANTSPPLIWSGVPDGAKSLALIVDDPDAPDPAAPKTIWVHWILYNLPPQSNGLRESISHADLGAEVLEGLNDWKRTGYDGPCPPIGKHRYFHRLYALDIILPDLHEPTKADLEAAMQGHILAQTELVGRFQH